MRWGNARQAIHDAFASGQTQPNPDEMGGTKFSSNAAIAHQAEAGLIIQAVLEQPIHLRGISLWINAPDGWVTDRELIMLKARLWSDFRRKTKDLQAWSEAILVAVLDVVMANYRKRCHNHNAAGMYSASDLQQLMGAASEEQVRVYRNRLTDLLQKYDSDSLQPVWAVIHEQRDKRNAEIDRQTA